MNKIDKLQNLIVKEVPHYYYKKSHYRYLKKRIANWLMEGWLDENSVWYNKLLKILKNKSNKE